MRFFTVFAREFIAFLKQHHTVLDPTMNIFEGLFSGDPSAVTPELEEIAFFAADPAGDAERRAGGAEGKRGRLPGSVPGDVAPAQGGA